MSKTPGFPDLRIRIAIANSKDISEMCSLLQDHTLGSSYHSQAGFCAFASKENTNQRIKFLTKQKYEYDFKKRLMLACIIGKKNVKFTDEEEKRIQETIRNLDNRKISNIQEKASVLLNKGIPNIKVLNKEPDAVFFVLIEIDSNLGKSPEEISSKIADKNGPAILPSSFFRFLDTQIQKKITHIHIFSESPFLLKNQKLFLSP